MSGTFFVYVVRHSDREVVKKFGPMGESRAERVCLGILHNLDQDNYFVCDSEAEVDVGDTLEVDA